MITTQRPTIVCLCGSTRFSETFRAANLVETIAGNIVLSIGCDMHSDEYLFKDKSEAELKAIKSNLDELHLRKIDLADEVLILNLDGYIGESTRRELDYAKQHHKRVRFWEPVSLCPDCYTDLHHLWTENAGTADELKMYRCIGCGQEWGDDELRKAAYLESHGDQP